MPRILESQSAVHVLPCPESAWPVTAHLFRPLSRQVIENQLQLLQDTNRNTLGRVLGSPGGGLRVSTTGAGCPSNNLTHPALSHFALLPSALMWVSGLRCPDSSWPQDKAASRFPLFSSDQITTILTSHTSQKQQPNGNKMPLSPLPPRNQDQACW